MAERRRGSSRKDTRPASARAPAPAPAAHLITRAEMARRLGISKPAITKACRDGGRLAPACQGSSINMLHEAAQRWLVERAGCLDEAEGSAPARPRAAPAPAPAPAPRAPEPRTRRAPRAAPRDPAPRDSMPAAAPSARAVASRAPDPGAPPREPGPARPSSRRRPAPAPPPVELPPIPVDDDEPEDAQSIEDLEAELGPRKWTNLAELAEPLTVLTEHYGDAREFESWIRGRKALEEARKAQMLRERLEGRLIARTTVVRMFEHLDTAFRLLLQDAPRAIATRLAPQEVATVAALVRDVMSQHLVTCRDKLDGSLASDDPLAPLAEAAE